MVHNFWTQPDDLRTIVARAIYEKARPRSAAIWEDAGQGYRGRFYAQADAAIAAAEPIIRAALYDELINDTVWIDGWAETPKERERMGETRMTIIDWLRARKESEHGQ